MACAARPQPGPCQRADKPAGAETGTGHQRHAVVPAGLTQAGTLLLLPTAISEDRSQTRWGEYRYAATGGNAEISADYVTRDGQAVVLLPPTHPSTLQPAAEQ